MLRSPLRAIAAVCFMCLAGWTIQSWLHAGYFTVLALLLMWGQIAGFFLPTTYVLAEEGVKIKGLISAKARSWSEFRSYYEDRNGILLSPFVGRSRLERFRGLSLQFHGNRDEVRSFVEKAMLAQEGREAPTDAPRCPGEA